MRLFLYPWQLELEKPEENDAVFRSLLVDISMNGQRIGKRDLLLENVDYDEWLVIIVEIGQ
jgi:hypothetical protein